MMWWWLACTTPPPPGPAPVPQQALLDVFVDLDEAVDRARQGDRQATEAWARAHGRFEAQVEPALRTRHPRPVVAGVEYRFSRIRAALTDGSDAQAEVDALEARLQGLFQE